MAVTVGLDEVGRGAWAGPLVAAAVALDDTELQWLHQDGPSELRDSKKLSRKQREVLAAYFQPRVKAYGVGWVTPGEIDRLGLTAAVRLAMLRAMKKLHENLTAYDEIIIDGNINFLAPCERLDLAQNTLKNGVNADVRGLTFHRVRTVVRADDLIPAVSAASIIAKVARDDYMREIASRYPGYGFENHVGYGTAAHAAALKQLGVCEVHRKSYAPVRALIIER